MVGCWLVAADIVVVVVVVVAAAAAAVIVVVGLCLVGRLVGWLLVGGCPSSSSSWSCRLS